MTKIAINTGCGFFLSDIAMRQCIERGVEAIEKIPLKEFGFEEFFVRDAGEHYKGGIDGCLLHDNTVHCFNSCNEKARTDPELIDIVERLGMDANYKNSNLKIVEMPDEVSWCIRESESGEEFIVECGR